VQQRALTLLPGNGALRLGYAHRGWPLALARQRVLLKHQLELELSLLPARARRGPHRPPAARTRVQDESLPASERERERERDSKVLGAPRKTKKKKKVSRSYFQNFFCLSPNCVSLRKYPSSRKVLDVTSSTFPSCFPHDEDRFSSEY